MTTNGEKDEAAESRPVHPLVRTDTEMSAEGDPRKVEHGLGVPLQEGPDPEHDIDWDVHKPGLKYRN